MLFNSLEFLIFLPIVVFVYFLIKQKFRWVWLFLASAFFYMYHKPIYILLLFYVILINYFGGMCIGKYKTQWSKKVILILCLFLNIAVLAWFKYYNFLNTNLTSLLGILEVENPLPHANIFLPLGISFFTFQGMSYTIDVYRDVHKHEKHLGIFSTYLMFFPQLVAGPIERAKNLLDQFYVKHSLVYSNIVIGLRLILLGMFKKIVIADRIGLYVSEVYSHSDKYEGYTVIIAVFLFTFQLYCDFSGYTDMALGSARMIGFKLMQNFNRPFAARTISEFWRRWHISLSSWINDYLYNPIVVQRRDWGKWAIVYSLLVSFTLIGLWHGASWNFVIFGLMHGVILSYEALTKKIRRKWSTRFNGNTYNTLSVVLTFSFFTFSIIFFRSSSLHQSFSIIHKMFLFSHENFLQFLQMDIKLLYNVFISIPLIAAMLAIEYVQDSEKFSSYFLQSRVMRYSIYIFGLVTISFFGVFLNQNDFIYFQF